MRNVLRLITAPTKLAVSVSDARQHLRVEDLDSDSLIATYIQAAQQSLSLTIGRSLVPAGYELDLFWWCREIEIPIPPLQSVTAVKTRGTDGTLSAIDPSLFTVTTTAEGRGSVLIPGGYAWRPVDYGQVLASIEFTAGYDVVPAPLRAAVLLMVGTLFDNRADVAAAAAYTVPGIDRLVAPYIERYV